jgi:4-hydroxybenzoate polyprenyltransferase
MGVNRYIDRDIDALNPRTASRPSVDGRVSHKYQQIFIVTNAFLFIMVAFYINELSFKLSFLFLLILGSYTYFKRFSSMAHLVLGVSLGLAPIAGVIAVSQDVPLWSIILALGVVFWVAGFDLLYSLQDIEFDKEHGLFSIPSIYGVDATMKISRIFHILTTVLWLWFAISSHSGLFMIIGIGVSAIMLYIEHKIISKDFSKIDKAFFTVNGYIGFIMLAFTILDQIYYIGIING